MPPKLKLKDFRIKLVLRDGRKCMYCGDEKSHLEVEHITPKSKGGANDIKNLVLACIECNRKKADLLPYEIQDPNFRKKVLEVKQYANSKKYSS